MKKPTSRFSRALKVAVALGVGLAGAGFGASGCLTRPLCVPDCKPHTTNLFVSVYQNLAIDKIDLLFAIDDSSSMADKQKTLQAAVPDLIGRLVSPNCINKDDPSAAPIPMLDPNAPCQNGFQREFAPITNIHIGIVTSSLGGHGVACPVQNGDFPDDQGHLMGSIARYASPGAPNVAPEGFLNWNPNQNQNQSSTAFATDFGNMVAATGQRGCGFEAQMESFYHFLADPNPYGQVTLGTCPGGAGQCTVASGTDQTILAQRAAFLRPDSLLAVIMLTDENDCSIVDDGQGFFVVQNANGAMFKGSAACDSNPNDACCVPCSPSGGTPAAGAMPGGCDPNGCAGRVQNGIDDKKSLRCFNMRQRFGVDYLYPAKRYVNALLLPQLCTSKHDLDPAGGCPDNDGQGGPDLAPNPIYSNLGTSTAAIRTSDLVFFAGIVGVPWQDIDDEINSTANDLRYLKAADIPWDVVLGNPNSGTTTAPVLPTDQHMLESRQPRSGLPGPGSGYLADAINGQVVAGHEFSNTDGPGQIGEGRDLQHACIFQLATPNTCVAGDTSCDCDPNIAYVDPANTFDLNPLCQGANGAYTASQGFGKAYPGLRELEALREFGENSVVASICARNLTDNTRADYGYRPAVTSIINRLAEKLGPPCLPRKLDVGPDGVPCSIIEAVPPGGDCSMAGRTPVTNSQVTTTAQVRLKAEGVCDATGKPACSAYTFCELDELGPECQTQVVLTSTTPSWCYVDTTQGGNRAVTAGCERAIRFADPTGQNPTPRPGARALIACFGAAISGDVTVTPVGDGGP